MIVNSTSSVSFANKFDLSLLKNHSAIVKPKRNNSDFKAIILRHNTCTFLIYANGRCVIVGCKSLLDVESGLRWLEQETGNVVSTPIKTHNLVDSVDYGAELNLTSLFKAAELIYENRHFGTFEPELSPAFIFDSPNHKGKTLIFRTGKVIVTGVTSVEQINQVHHEIQRMRDLTQWV